MTLPRHIQIHTLHSYAASLLNRDESGLAKRMPFGDAVRTRISSQCLKRHWRKVEDEFAIHNVEGATEAVRSRNTVDRLIIAPLVEDGTAATEVLDALREGFNAGVYGSRGTDRSARQPLLLGLPEVEYLRTRAAQIAATHPTDAASAKEAAARIFSTRAGEGDNLRAMRESTVLPGGLESALFGRMVTSDTAANIEAAIHVAHAFTVHREESEMDFFSVVDDLQVLGDDSGADHMGDSELTSGIFYGYVVVDVAGLVSNTTGCKAADWQGADRELAASVIRHLLYLIATVSPGAKRGPTAPYSRADFMLVETGTHQPRTLANAYRNPCKAQMGDSIRALSAHLTQQDEAYGQQERRMHLATLDCEVPGSERLPMPALAARAAQLVRGDETA